MSGLRAASRRPVAGRRMLPAFVLCAGLACVVGLAGCQLGAQSAPERYYPVIVTPTGQQSPTPPPLTYTVGAWPSNSAPPQVGTVTIYISFRSSATPVAGASATVDVGFPNGWRGYGPIAIDARGYGAFRLSYSDPFAGRPVMVQVHVTYQGQTYNATTSFTPV